MLHRSWSGVTGEYVLQGAHRRRAALAVRAEDTRWDRIAAHYAELEGLARSPVVRLNRAVAVAEAGGPAAGLALLDGLDAALPHSHRLAAVRGALLADLAGPNQRGRRTPWRWSAAATISRPSICAGAWRP